MSKKEVPVLYVRCGDNVELHEFYTEAAESLNVKTAALVRAILECFGNDAELLNFYIGQALEREVKVGALLEEVLRTYKNYIEGGN